MGAQAVNQVYQEHAIQTLKSEPQEEDARLAQPTRDHRTVYAQHQNVAQENSLTAMVCASHVIMEHSPHLTEEAADTQEDHCCSETRTRLKNLSAKRKQA